MSTPCPMHSLMETWVPLCGIVCLSQSPYFCSPTLVRMCTCISTWNYVHLTVHVCYTPMHSLMETWVPLYVSVFVSQSPVCTTCLECVHASVHVYMSTQLPVLAQHPMDSYMETWVPLCDSECVCPSHPASGQSPWLECVTCIGT